MFKSVKTPEEYVKMSTEYFSAFPKTVDEVKDVLEKTKNVYETEAENAKSVIATYTKASRGDASINEIAAANKKAQELMIAARFAAIMSMPGAVFALPLLTKISDEYSFDLVPASVKAEFDL